jgi:predicted nucleic acid-binding protein
VLVIADTGPVNYLLLIEHIGILPKLFGTVILPSAVRDELSEVGSPLPVRKWIADPPSWLDVRPVRSDCALRESLKALDSGEAEAISLAMELRADLLLMDDREGVIAARREGFAVTGTLGVLGLAAERGLIKLADAFERLKGTNFRYRQEIMDRLLERPPRGGN